MTSNGNFCKISIVIGILTVFLPFYFKHVVNDLTAHHCNIHMSHIFAIDWRYSPFEA
jgi:hypothetical protein